MTENRAPGATISQSDPIWSTDHVALALGVSTETAQQYAARSDFPPARQVAGAGGRLLWRREDVVTWFAGLPARSARVRRAAAGRANSPTTVAYGKVGTAARRVSRGGA